MITEALKDHNKVIYIMKQRNDILESLLHKHWVKKDFASTLTSLLAIKDQNIFVDALACTFAQHPKSLESLTLDHSDKLLLRCLVVL